MYTGYVLTIMRKLAASLFLIAVSLWAADFWQTKPFTEWSDKDTEKMLHNSPWARTVGVSIVNPMQPAPGGGGGRNRGTGAMGPETGAGSTNGMGEIGASGVGGARGGRGGAGPGEEMGGGGPAPVTVIVSWETALPVRQARVRMKYGAEAATSAEAKKALAPEPNVYVIAVSGPILRGLGGREDASKDGSSGDAMKKAVMEQTSLTAKGKDPLKPTNIEIGRGAALFYFPKTAPFSLDDKEVEFSTKAGETPLKYKFRLKDMVVNGKLEL